MPRKVINDSEVGAFLPRPIRDYPKKLSIADAVEVTGYHLYGDRWLRPLRFVGPSESRREPDSDNFETNPMIIGDDNVREDVMDFLVHPFVDDRVFCMEPNGVNCFPIQKDDLSMYVEASSRLYEALRDHPTLFTKAMVSGPMPGANIFRHLTDYEIIDAERSVVRHKSILEISIDVAIRRDEFIKFLASGTVPERRVRSVRTKVDLDAASAILKELMWQREWRKKIVMLDRQDLILNELKPILAERQPPGTLAADATLKTNSGLKDLLDEVRHSIRFDMSAALINRKPEEHVEVIQDILSRGSWTLQFTLQFSTNPTDDQAQECFDRFCPKLAKILKKFGGSGKIFFFREKPNGIGIHFHVMAELDLLPLRRRGGCRAALKRAIYDAWVNVELDNGWKPCAMPSTVNHWGKAEDSLSPIWCASHWIDYCLKMFFSNQIDGFLCGMYPTDREWAASESVISHLHSPSQPL